MPAHSTDRGADHSTARRTGRRVALVTVAGLLLAGAGGLAPASAATTGTFEETVPSPGNVTTQYCNDPATSRGVQSSSRCA